MSVSKAARRPKRPNRAARILAEAQKLAAHTNSWADFSNALFDPEHGLLVREIPDVAQRRSFAKTREYAVIDRLLAKLMERFGVADGATPRKSGKFAVRVPKTLHLALEREAAEEGVSLNQLVVAKLAVSLSRAGR